MHFIYLDVKRKNMKTISKILIALFITLFLIGCAESNNPVSEHNTTGSGTIEENNESSVVDSPIIINETNNTNDVNDTNSTDTNDSNSSNNVNDTNNTIMEALN